MSKFFHYLSKILRHKCLVWKYCRWAGLYWQGLTHDWSKFSCVEFREGLKYYHLTDSEFEIAKLKQHDLSYGWLHHRGRNPHHYEYWRDNLDDVRFIRKRHAMPYRYVVEMLADIYAHRHALYQPDYLLIDRVVDYWETKRKTAKAMHPATSEFVTWFIQEAQTRKQECASARQESDNVVLKTLFQECRTDAMQQRYADMITATENHR